MVDPEKEKFKKMLLEFDKERTEKKMRANLKIDPMQNREQWQKTNQENHLWVTLKIAEIFKELRQWAYSD